MTPKEINERISRLKNIDYVCNDGSNAVYQLRIPKSTIMYNWAESISDAFELFEEAKRSPFNKRTEFFRILGRMLTKIEEFNDGTKVMWPDALVFLNAETICLSYIAWKEGEKVCL